MFFTDSCKQSAGGGWDTCVLKGNIGASYAPGEIRNTLPNGSISKIVGNKDGSGRIANRDVCVCHINKNKKNTLLHKNNITNAVMECA